MTPTDNTFHSAFGDDVPEPKGRPLECTLCGSGSHNRSTCPWGAENYRMPPATAHTFQGKTWDEAVAYARSQDYSELELRVMAGMQNTARKLHSLEQARAMQNAHPPFLEELAAHLDGQEAPKPAPQLGTRPLGLDPLYAEALKRRLAERQALYSAVDAMAQAEPPSPPSRLRRVWRAIKTVVLGTV